MQSSHRNILTMAVIGTVLSIAHHVDHVIRGNHSGWPFIDMVTPFTWSLGFYPLLAYGLYKGWQGKVNPLFWCLAAFAGFVFATAIHFGPHAYEPPGDITGPYASPIAGLIALAALFALMIVMALQTVYSFRVWWRERKASREDNAGRSYEDPV